VLDLLYTLCYVVIMEKLAKQFNRTAQEANERKNTQWATEFYTKLIGEYKDRAAQGDFAAIVDVKRYTAGAYNHDMMRKVVRILIENGFTADFYEESTYEGMTHFLTFDWKEPK